MADRKTIKAVSDLGRRFSDSTILMHEAIALKAGLSGTDHKYLNMLIDRGSMTAGELAKISGLTTGAITGVIDRLEKRKLVKRQFDSDDRRKVIIVPDFEMTAKVLGPSFELLRKKIMKLVSVLSKDEMNIVEKYLKDTIKIMDDLTGEFLKDN